MRISRKRQGQIMLARLYHTHHSRHMEDLPFWLDLARQQGGPILELGCGSGRVTLPVVEAGYKVVGLDHNPEMLDYLRERLSPPVGDRLRLSQADMTAFDLGKRFPLILLPCNTYSAFGANQRRSLLDCVRRHLSLQGLFAASLPNPNLLRRLPRTSDPDVEESFPHPLDGEPVQVSSGWERSAGRLTVTWHYDHLLPDGSVERLSMQASHDLAPAQAHLAEIEAAGLRLVDTFGDFDRSPFTPQSPLMIFIAAPQP